MSRDAQTSLAVLLLDIKDEIDAAKLERRQVIDSLQRARISELDRAFASLSRAEDFERDARRHYQDRLGRLETRERRMAWTAGAGAALGALLLTLLLLMGFAAYGAASPGLCAALGGEPRADARGPACILWGSPNS